jgi:hypothetical protein
MMKVFNVQNSGGTNDIGVGTYTSAFNLDTTSYPNFSHVSLVTCNFSNIFDYTIGTLTVDGHVFVMTSFPIDLPDLVQ